MGEFIYFQVKTYSFIRPHTIKHVYSNLTLAFLNQTLKKLWNTWDHKWGAWPNNESMRIEEVHLKAWNLICHKDKIIGCFLNYTLKYKSFLFLFLFYLFKETGSYL